MKARAVFILLLVATLIVGVAFGQAKHSMVEQTQFNAEDEAVKSPVRIPDDAWTILKADSYVQNVLENANLIPDQLSRSWFSAAIVHLHGDKEKDLLVMAEGELRGANISPFWVFMETPQGMKLVLNTSAHDVLIRSSRWHGYRVIEFDGMTCCEISRTWLRYENGEYRDFRHVTKEIK
jgi:hypothetical protein